MKKSPWQVIRETFADTPDNNRRTPIAKRFKYAPIAGPSKKTPQFPSRVSNQNETPNCNSSSSKTTPLSTRHPTSRFKFGSHKRALTLAEIIDDDVENQTKLPSSPSRRRDSQPLLSICNTPETKDRLAVDESSCESVTFDPDYDDYRIDTILTAKSSSNPLKCVSMYRRTARASKSSVCSNLSGRFVQHPESPVSLVVPDSQAIEENLSQISERGLIVVPDSEAINFSSPNIISSNTITIRNSQVIEAFESEPNATQSSIEFRIDEANSESNYFSQTQAATSNKDLEIIWSTSNSIPCSQISSNEEQAVSPSTVIETQSSADTPPLKPIGIGQYTKQKKPLRPIKGGLLEELIKCKHKAQSQYNFWHNMRRAGVEVPYTVMMVTGVEKQSYGRVLVYAKKLECDYNAESRALFTFDGNMQFCSRLQEGAQFEVNLSEATGYSIRNGVVAYPAVQEILML